MALNKVGDSAAFRAEIELELRNKKQCANKTYECTQLSLDGYKFCSKHILQDKNASFKQCSYMYGNLKQCHIPAQRLDKRDFGYCSEHALKATLARNKQNAKNSPPKTAEVLLHSLAHYIKNPHQRNNSSGNYHYLEDSDQFTDDERKVKSSDPFVDIDASIILNEKCNEVLDFCSESDSDIEASTLSEVWPDTQADTSENESIDSEQEDPLKHVNVYTSEEISSITRDKLIRLQSLYIEQYRHLQYLLTEKRRKYLHSLKRERETCCNISTQVHDNPKEQRLYKKLKALNNYQRSHGTDGILNKKLRDLRLKITEGSLAKNSSYSKCFFTEGGVKCGERSIPLSKYCQKHILEDPNQVLYRPCGKTTGDVTCTTPIAALFDESTCHLHLEIPVLRSYNQVRKDSESDVDDAVDSHLQYTSQLTEDIKNEFINYVPPEIPNMETVPSMLFEENSMSNNELMNENFLFGNDSDQNNSDNKLDFKIDSQDTVQEMNIDDMPECLSGEVEISTEVESQVKGQSIKTSETNVREPNSTEEHENMDIQNEDVLIALKQSQLDDITINPSTESKLNIQESVTGISNEMGISTVDVEKSNVTDTVTLSENMSIVNKEVTEVEISTLQGEIPIVNETSMSNEVTHNEMVINNTGDKMNNTILEETSVENVTLTPNSQ